MTEQTAITPQETTTAQVYKRIADQMELLMPFLPDQRSPQFPLSKADLHYSKFVAMLIHASGTFRPEETSFADLMLLSIRATLSGFDPTEIIENLYIIKDKRGGRPKIAADVSLLLAKVLESGVLSELTIPDSEQVRREKKATVVAVRRDNGMRVSMTFSIEDAETAGLMGKNNWSNYWPQMLINRALTMALRKSAIDVLKRIGKYSTEELTGSEQPIGADGQVVTDSHIIIENPHNGHAPTAPATIPGSSLISELAADPIEDIDEEAGEADASETAVDESGDIPPEFDPLAEQPDVEDKPGKPQPPTVPPTVPPSAPAGWANADSLLWVAEQMRAHVKAKCVDCTKEEVHSAVVDFIELVAAEKAIAKFDRHDASSYPIWNLSYPNAQALLDAATAAYDQYGAPEESDDSDWSKDPKTMAEFEAWSRAVFGLSAADLLARTGKKAFGDLGSTVKVAKETTILIATTEGAIPVIVYDAKYEKNAVVYRTMLGKPVRDWGDKTAKTSGRDRLRAFGPEWAAYAEGMTATFTALPQPVLLTLAFGNNGYTVNQIALLQADPV